MLGFAFCSNCLVQCLTGYLVVSRLQRRDYKNWRIAVVFSGTEKPQCLIHCEVLTNEGLEVN
jgi:hypothetical protein